MNFSYKQLNLDAGDLVEVTLDQQANVLLLDSSNFSSFRAGSSYQYLGGLAEKSPFRMMAPTSGTWYVVINLGGYAGSVNFTINVLQQR